MTDTLNNKQEQFKSECKLINLKYEYEGYTGKEQWAIITELTKQEILEKYPEEIKQYIPFVLLSAKQGDIIAEYTRIEDKYRKRQINNEDFYGYEDGFSEVFHKELIEPEFLLPDEEKEIQLQEKMKKKILQERLSLLGDALNTLTPIQRRRIEECYLNGKSSRKIAKEEGVNYSAVDKSIALALKKLRKFY